MHTAMMLSFQDELEKIASHAAELAGLGILAAPSAAHLGGKEWSEKNKSRAEVAGLGVLAGPSALAVGKKAVGKGKAVLRAANVNKLRKAATEVAKHASDDNVINFQKKKEVKARTHLKNMMSRSREQLRSKATKGAALWAGGTLASIGGGLALNVALKNREKKKEKQKEAAPSMSAMMNMHRLADAAKAAKNVAKPAAQAAVKMPSQAAHAARASQYAGHAASGGHAWNPAAQAKRAIPL